MRRGSRSGPSDVTMNATSTFAASVCASDVSPADLRTIALRRGSTARISPSPSPTQSPTATSTLSCISLPGQARTNGLVGRLHVVRSAVRRDHASRHEAGLKLFGELRVPPERAEIELRQRRFSFGT